MTMRDLQRLEELSSAAALGLWADDVVLALDRARSGSALVETDATLLSALILAGYQTDLLQRIVGRRETVAEASSQSSSATAEESIRNRKEMSPTFYRPLWRLSSR